jgi:hypothetical protein
MNADRDELDRLITAPLPAVEDAGFSAHVTTRILAARARRGWLELAGILVTAGILLAFLPLGSLTGTIEYLSFGLGNSLPFAMAALAIVLSVSFARIGAD